MMKFGAPHIGATPGIEISRVAAVWWPYVTITQWLRWGRVRENAE